jgi:hypothetical protein
LNFFLQTYFVLDVSSGELTKTKYYSLRYSTAFSDYDETQFRITATMCVIS